MLLFNYYYYYFRFEKIKDSPDWKCFICCASEYTGQPPMREKFLASIVNGSFNPDDYLYNVGK